MIEQFLKFCVVGGSGLFVDFGITYLCKEWLRLNKYAANSLGFLCASTTNYVLNRLWTFHNENPDIAGQPLREAPRNEQGRPGGIRATTARLPERTHRGAGQNFRG